jgi:formamidopyrimidine-DNA glycosylase
VHVERKLALALTGRRIVAAEIGDPLVLRVMVRDRFPECLASQTVRKVVRRGHFLCIELDTLVLAVNFMLSGKMKFGPPKIPLPRSCALVLRLDDGEVLSYLDETRMGKIYAVAAAELGQVPQLDQLGVEVLSAAFTAPLFRKLIAGRRQQVRQFLRDKSALASIGNAYADEILFAAGLHPKTFCHQLTPDEVDRLHGAIVAVLKGAVDEIERRDPPIEVKVRDFLAVRGRAGKPCPRCATKIRAVRVGDGDACFCPKCQPTGRKLFIDWSKLPAKS